MWGFPDAHAIAANSTEAPGTTGQAKAQNRAAAPAQPARPAASVTPQAERDAHRALAEVRG